MSENVIMYIATYNFLYSKTFVKFRFPPQRFITDFN